MKVLIVFYDRSTLKNIVPTLAVCPDIIMYFYDHTTFSYKDIYSTYETCRKYLPSLHYEVGAINEHDYQNVANAIKSYIDSIQPAEVCIDLTGGSELSVIAGYETGRLHHCKTYYTDIWKNSIIDLELKKEVLHCPPYELEDLISAYGGKVIEYTDHLFLRNYRQSLEDMAHYILHHLSDWLKTCQYFQKYNSKLRQENSLHFKGPLDIKRTDNDRSPNPVLLERFQKNFLISNLKTKDNYLQFDYNDIRIMNYMSSYGVWLELYTYYQLCDFREIHDAQTSVKIDWNIYDQIEIVGNEVDVTGMYHCRPVIISCKQSTTAINADPLNELYVVSRRLGGKYAIPILITCSQMKSRHLGMFLKAKEMGIHLLDQSDVLSDDFAERLRQIIIK